MKTKFGTVTLVPSHKGGFHMKQANEICWDITKIINEYIFSQVQGDFLVDINSFCEYPVGFAILRFSETEGWTEYADHNMIIKRLEQRYGIIRLHLGEMLSAIIRGHHIRIWNYLDAGGNTLGLNISETGVKVPHEVSFALHRAGLKRREFEVIIEEICKEVKTSKPAKFSLGILAFRGEEWSPSQALTVVQHDSFDIKNFDLNLVDLSPLKNQGCKTPKATRRTKKPALITSTRV